MAHRHRDVRTGGTTAHTLAAVLLFAVGFALLCLGATANQSATWDEPLHLAAGYAALTRADFRLEPEHPPLARIWAALPLALTPGVKFDTQRRSWRRGPQWLFGHQFLYRDNDADRLLIRSRAMVVLLGIGLGALIFLWARQLWGFWAAVGALVLYCLEPNELAHAGLVTADTACSLLYFGTVYFLWRLLRRFSWGNLTGLVVFFSLAQVTKFSALLLFVVVPIPLAVQVWRSEGWRGAPALSTRARRARAALLTVGLLAASSYLSIWAVYASRYDPAPTAKEFQFEYDVDARMKLASSPLDRVIGWVDENRLLPRAYARGLLLSRGKSKERRGYLLGEVRLGSWWYYFPLAILVKTPLVLLGLGLLGFVLALVRRELTYIDRTALLLPPTLFLAAAMLSSLNIGLRHVLPVYPFLVLLAAGAGSVLFRRRRWLLAAPAILLLVEFMLVYPYCIAAFNLAAGGPESGHRFLSDSNLDWGQDLKRLGRWMRENDVERINLSYFGTAYPPYYGIRCTYLPGTADFLEVRPSLPILPGYVAISMTNLYGVYGSRAERRLYRPLIEREPVVTIGHSIRVYRVERPWW